MATFPYKTGLIVGVGPGISASLARRLSARSVGVGLAARDVEKLKGLADETGAKTFTVDATDPSAVAKLFIDIERLLAEPDVVIYNPGSRVAGRLAELDPAAVERCVAINAVRCLSSCAAGGKADGAAGTRRDSIHGRDGRREGVC